MRPIPFLKQFTITALLVFAVFNPQTLAAPPSALAGSPLDTEWSQALERAVLRAINPEDYQCGPTLFDDWIGEKLGAIQDLDAFFDIFFNYGAWFWVFEYTLRFDQSATDEYLGIDGRKTQELTKRHRDNQRFWDVSTKDVLLQGAHGAILADDSKMVPLVQAVFLVSAAEAQAMVDYVQSVIENVPGIGFDNPLFTLNAFAFSARGEPPGSPYLGLPDKIVMGDGIMQAYADLGLDANSSDMIFAHEFAHHVQYELGILDIYVPVPEFTRRIELMADAFGSYFSAHSRGASFQTKRMVEVYRGSYIIGDCFFDDPGHHGTPNQREAAARWGAGLAQAAQKQGKILPSALLLSLFDAHLPTIVAPDAP
jgi:hypothetical protein